MTAPAMTAAKFAAILKDVRGGTAVRTAIKAAGSGANAFYTYVDEHEDAAEQYARAKGAQLEAMADEMVQISDEALVGTITKETKDGTFQEVGDNVQRAKLMVDTRKWLLSKLAPKKYGERVEIDGKLDLGHTLVERLANGRERADD